MLISINPPLNGLKNRIMITYNNHPETEEIKAHTDILLNGEYIGYYIKANEVL